MSLFVAFEGLPGSGKTTAIRRIMDYLKRKGFSFSVVDIETTGFAPELRDIARIYPLGHPARILLFWILRIQQYDFAMRQLENLDVVIADRFWGSSFAFDFYGNGVPLPVLNWVGEYINHQPDVTFFFDVPLDVAITRKESGTMKDLDFARRAERGYLALAKEYGWIRVDATQSIEKVEDFCLKTIFSLQGVHS